MRFGLRMDPDTTSACGKRDDAGFKVGVGFGFGGDYISSVCFINYRSRQGAKVARPNPPTRLHSTN